MCHPFGSCDHGYVRLWDGIRQPGLYRYPPNTLCGIFTSRPEVMKFSSDYALEVELYHPHADPRISLTFTYKYVDFGEFFFHYFVQNLYRTIITKLLHQTR